MSETLNAVRNRPRFRLLTTLSPKEFTERLKENLDKKKNNFIGKLSNEESYIEVRTQDSPIWKPRLTLRVEIDEEKGTIVRGIFGPNSSVWTFFMFLYIFFGTILIIVASLYYSLKLAKAKNDADYNWAGPATIFCLGIIVFIYILAKIGQLKSKKEMRKLRDFAEEVVVKYKRE